MFWQDLRLKLRYIGWPYLRVWLGSVAVAAGLNAALARLLPFAEPPEWLWIWVGPGVVGAALVLGLLWTHFRLLRDGRNGANLGQFLVIVALGTLVAAWGGLATGLRASLGTLQPVATLADAAAHPARYYQPRHMQLDTTHLGVEQQAEVTGRNDETLSFMVYVACPVAAPAPAAPPAWLGWQYEQSVSNSLSDAEKDAAYKVFLDSCNHQFARDKHRPFTYLERCPNDGERRGLLAAARSKGYTGSAGPLLLLPRYEPFAQRGHAAWQFFGWSQLLGNGLFALLLLVLPLHEDRREQVLAGQFDTSRGWLLDYLRVFWPRPGYVLTPLLLDANIAIFLLMMADTGAGLSSFSPAALLTWGGNYGPDLATGQWWRLLASTFVHANLLHLANNMVLLFVLGWQLETALGSLRPLVVYLLAGLGASLLSTWYHPAVVGVGASGALFGWMGLALTLYWRPQTPPGLKAVLGTVVLGIGVASLVLGFFIPGVDNVAHVGGLLTGTLAGVLLWPWLRPALAQHAADDDEAPPALPNDQPEHPSVS